MAANKLFCWDLRDPAQSSSRSSAHSTVFLWGYLCRHKRFDFKAQGCEGCLPCLTAAGIEGQRKDWLFFSILSPPLCPRTRWNHDEYILRVIGEGQSVFRIRKNLEQANPRQIAKYFPSSSCRRASNIIIMISTGRSLIVREMWSSTVRQLYCTPEGSINILPSAWAALWSASCASSISKAVESAVSVIVDEGSQPSFGLGSAIVLFLLLKVELHAFTPRPLSTDSASISSLDDLRLSWPEKAG